MTIITPASYESSNEHNSASESDSIDGQDRVMPQVPCLHCRHKKRRCDGYRPMCSRCQQSKTQCIYADEAAEEVADDLTAMRQEMDKLEKDFMEAKRSVVGANNRTELKVVLRGAGNEAEAKGRPWIITLTNQGARVEFTSFCQLYEMLARISGSTNFLYRPPTSTSVYPTEFRGPLGPFTFVNGLYLSVHTMNSQDTKSVPVSIDMEDAFLNFILWHPVQCGSSNVIIGRFSLFSHAQRQFTSYKILCYAIGAMNAHHYLVHHITAFVQHLLPPGTNMDKFGRELAARFFSKARDLLSDEIFDENFEEPSVNTVHALFCMYMYSFHTKNFQSASLYSRMTYKVASQLDFHRALNDQTKTAVDAEEIAMAMAWDWIVACECSVAVELKPLTRGITNSVTPEYLRKLTPIASAGMSEEKLQAICEILSLAKLKQINPDISLSAGLTHKTLDESIQILESWAHELHPRLHLSSLKLPWRSCFSFLRAVHVQLEYHMSLFGLYEPYLQTSSELEPGLAGRAELGYSDAAVMITRLLLAYLRYGGCTFFAHIWARTSKAHALLAQSMNEEIARKHQVYVAGAQEVKNYVDRRTFLCLDVHMEEYDSNLMMKQEAENDNEALGFVVKGKKKFRTGSKDMNIEADYFEPLKEHGVNW